MNISTSLPPPPSAISGQLLKKGSIRLVENESLTEIVRSIATEPTRTESFFVLYVDEVVKKVQFWRKLLPRVHLFYAVKCNSQPALLTVLAALGAGFDCASKEEVRQVLALGVEPSHVIYANPYKSISHLRYAHKVNVPLMTFDTLMELDKIKTHHPNAQLVLRIRSAAVNCTLSLDEKYGVSLQDTKTLLTHARSLGLQVVGVAFHVGCGSRESEAYYHSIATARKVFDEAEEIGFQMRLLDIGGGFPDTDFGLMKQHAEHINQALDEYFPDDGSVRVIGEPGRYVVGNTFTLLTPIIGRKDFLDKNGCRTSSNYVIDESIFGSFTKHLKVYESFVPEVLEAKPDEVTLPSKIWGHTLCSLDYINDQVDLPHLNLGDWLVWWSMGAYTRCGSSEFNGFTATKVEVVASHKTWDYLEECWSSHKNELLTTGIKTEEQGEKRQYER